MQRHIIIVFLFILAAFAIIFFAVPDVLEPTQKIQQTHTSSGEALIGGSFEAVNHRGETITQDDLKGQYAVLYFGFTHCPDICPTGLLTLGEALERLNPEISEKILPVFVTVDPNRDTPEVMRSYVQNFHPRLVGITGSEEQIDTIAKAYKVYYQIVEQSDSAIGYQVDHSGYFYLMDPKGKYITHFPHNISEQKLADRLREHVQ